MKRITVGLILILVAVYLVLSRFGTDDENAAERLFYQAMKTRQQIIINPDVAPPAMIASVEDNLQRIVEKYSQSQKAKDAHLVLAEFYLRNKKYEQARSTSDEIIKRYSEDRLTLSKAHFIKGTSFERQNQWERALAEYIILRDEYTDTLLGFEVPLYIANYYNKKGKYMEADQAYNEAVLFYEKLAQQGQGKVLGYAAANFLIQAHINLNNFEQAGRVLEDILNNYPSALAYEEQLPKVELIFVRGLSDFEKAIDIYRKIKEKTNDQQLVKFLEKKIRDLENR